MAARYQVHKVFLKSADFHVLLVEFPEEDITDKLTILSTERGLIYKSYYEDFVLNTCMVNAGGFFYHIKRRPELLEKFGNVRDEALAEVYKVSPGFKPENIVINSNNVFKTRNSVRSDEEVRNLIDNDLWGVDPPMTSFGPAIITNSPQKTDDEEENPFKDPDENGSIPAISDNDPDADKNPFIKDTDSDNGSGGEDGEIPYELIGHRWQRLGIHVNIRQYQEIDGVVAALLGGKPFKTIRGYHFLIAELCIEDYTDILHLIDTMGVTKTIQPHLLAEELYDMAVLYNPFLKFESVDLESIRREYKEKEREKQRRNVRNRKSASFAAEERTAATAKRGPKFSEVPREKLAGLAAALKKRIIGQDAAIDMIADAVLRASVGLKKAEQPVGAFLFMGYTGVGKTETAKVLAEELCGGSLVRVDCSEYQHSHEVAKLTGSPPGYVGYDDGGHLTREIAKKPFSVVLFDEVEKAHGNFHERVLQVLGDGLLTDNKGRKVSFADTIVIMTSNIGVKDVENISKAVGFGDEAVWSHDKQKDAYEGAAKKKFKPEFLNRIDEIVTFRRLEREDYMSILDVMLEEVNGQIQKGKTITLSFNVGAKNLLLDQGIDKKLGARPLWRTIKKYLSTPLAKAIISGDIKDGSKVVVGVDKEKTALTFKSK